MARSNAILSTIFSPEGSFAESDAAALPKNIGTVLPWPQNRSNRHSSISDDWRRADAILTKLSPQRPSGPNLSPSAEDDEPLLLFNRSSDKIGLREEIAEAVKVYDLTVACIRKALPTIAMRKIVEIEPLEHAVTMLVASLERNRDALICLTKIRGADGYVFSHATNVCIFAAAFALSCGSSRVEAIAVGLAGLLHDVGMALLPMTLLKSPTQLSPTEQVLVRRHPLIAGELLSTMPNLHSQILFAALEHHERYDGKGYPAGLSGSKISFIGHLTAISSAFDAMTSPRRHRAALAVHVALGEMFKQRNRQFHPAMLENFIKMVGVYPVGSAVILQDGYCGVVTASSSDNPTRPVITLLQDSKGHPMVPLELDMGKECVTSIAQCVSPAEKGIDVYSVLGVSSRL